MSGKTIGLGLFWMALAWALVWGVAVGTGFVNPSFRALSMEELQQTAWAPPGPLFVAWASAVPLAALVGAIGVALHAGVRGSKVAIMGAIGFVALLVAMAGAHGYLGHHPPVFAVGGALILLSFFGILRLWAAERAVVSGARQHAADLRLAGYVCMLLATWFVCGLASMPFLKAVKGLPTTSPMHSASSPIHVMIFLALGWGLLFLSHRAARTAS